MNSKTFEKKISTTGNSLCVVIEYNAKKKLNLKKGDYVKVKITKLEK